MQRIAGSRPLRGLPGLWPGLQAREPAAAVLLATLPTKSQPVKVMPKAVKKEPRNPVWKIEFENLTLSKDAREKIKKLLPDAPEEKRDYMFWRINRLCSFCAGTQADSAAVARPPHDKKTLKKSVQDRIKKLQEAIDGLDEYTEQVLAAGYRAEYPHPEFSKGDQCNAETITRDMLHNQNFQTSIWVPREYSGSGWVESCAEELPFSELLERVKYACEGSKNHAPKKAGINGSQKVFVSQLIGLFETCSGRKASTVQDGVFDNFLRAVCKNLDPKYPTGIDQSTIIKKAMAFNRAGLKVQKIYQPES